MNITFKKIIINNFLSLGSNIEVLLDDQGFVLVNGVNLETDKSQSNGSGKSSLFDAILWAITGDTLRGTNEVVNENSNEGCFCELEFVVEDYVYKIIRYKSHPEYGNSCHFYENDELISDQTKKSQDNINNKLPMMTTDILGSIVLLGQGLPYKFSSLSPINRKNLLETMSGSSSQIDHLKYLLDLKDAKVLQELSDINADKIRTESEINSNKQLIQHIESMQEDTSESILSKIQEQENLCRINEETIKGSSEELLRHSESYESIIKVYNNVNEYVGRLNQEISDLETKKQQIGTGICPTCNRPYDNYEERKKLSEEYSELLSDKSSTLSSLVTKKSVIKTQMDQLSSSIGSLNNQITSLNHQVNESKGKIIELNNKLNKSKDHDKQLSDTKKLIKDKEVELYDINKKISNFDDIVSTISYLKRQVSRDFKGYVLEDVIKYLSDRSKKYGSYFFSDHDINLVLKGNKILIHIDNRQYENLSGGERQRVDLCVQFALRDMLIVTSGFSCNLLVLDEAFDNLDMEGSQSLVELVTSEFFDVNSVFTITHHSDISIPYDKILTVVKNKSGVSTIEEQ